MSNKKTKIIYWVALAFTTLWFAASGYFELTKNAVVWDLTLKLGYPAYFIYLLGMAKLLGVAVLLLPGRLHRLKEWAFAGLFFDIMFAFASKLAVFGFPATTDAFVAFILVAVTYFMFNKVYTGASERFQNSYEIIYT